MGHQSVKISALKGVCDGDKVEVNRLKSINLKIKNKWLSLKFIIFVKCKAKVQGSEQNS